jgi:hypothetical protein
MTIKELNKLIKEELDAFLENEDELDAGAEGDDIEVTTDEPDIEDDPLATLRQIYDMLKPIVEPEEEVEDFEGEEEGEDLEGEEEVEDEGNEDEGGEDDVDEGKKEEEEVDENFNNLNESFDGAARFKKLANIIK